MTITAVGTLKFANSSTGQKSLSFTPGAVGNCIVVCALCSGTATQTGISDTGGNITWVFIGNFTHTSTPPNAGSNAMFLGVINGGAGTAITINVAYSASITTQAGEVTAQEFNSSLPGTWSVDGTLGGQRNATSSTNVTFPTKVPATANEIYYGFGQVANSALATGQTAGYTAAITTTFADLCMYNPAVSTSQSPIGKQNTAGLSVTICALIKFTASITLAHPTVAATAFALTRNKTLPMSAAAMVNAVAYQLAVLKALVLGSPSVTATAYAMTVSKGPVAITVVLASPTLAASAYAMSWVHTYPPLPSLTVAASAHPLGVSKTRTLDHPVVASQAYSMTLAKLKTLVSPTVAATAYAMTVAKAVALASPTMVTTAYVMHPSSPNNVHLDSPTCHATAYPMGVNKRYPPFLMHWWFHARGQHVPHWSEEQEKS